VIDSAALVAALKSQVLVLEDDLRTRLGKLPEVNATWRAEHRRTFEAERTASAWVAWRDDRITQAAVAWVVTTVFVRLCEDNRLLKPVWIAGPRPRRQEALDAQLAYFRRHPDDTDREWLLQAVDHLRHRPATRALVDEHSALWSVSPSGNAASALLAFWRRRDDSGELIFDFTDPELSTRFLGDLYQDLSEYAKKTYALLQTPVFVEEFILDQTLEPALAERPLDDFKIIDPACGSGHFLLGAFGRLLVRWDRQAPALELQERVQLALDSIHGVDLNPFAVAIARFRLTVAALQACGLTSLEQAPNWRYHLAAGDSLLHGSLQSTLPIDGADYDIAMSAMTYSTEDLEELKEILQPGRYDVVVGNPPYIAVKDKKLNEAYRSRYETCKGKYALTVPFMERFFQLATREAKGHRPGWVGQITSNSFMKREFGSKLIEQFFPKVSLSLVADTSGAYIPGHGTQTVIIVGRNARPANATVRAVLGVRGEPGRPENPADGLVWSSIVHHVDKPGYEDAWITVADLDRAFLAKHPWSLSGGGASDLLAGIGQRHRDTLSDRLYRVGFFGVMGAYDAMMVLPGVPDRLNLESADCRDLVIGDAVRDFRITSMTPAWFPYDRHHTLLDPFGWPRWRQLLWPLRTELGNRATFSGGTYFSDGRPYYAWHQLPKDLGAHAWTLTFAEVATHNHFVLDQGGKVFNQTAPVIKLPESATDDEHLQILGVLNSSTVCFWLKQHCYPKGGDPIGDDGARVSQQPWSDRYQFNGANVQEIPIPGTLPLERARHLDDLAQQLSGSSPDQIVRNAVPNGVLLEQAHRHYDRIRGLMISQQEELDWEVYGLYGLPGKELVYAGDDLPPLDLGERAFEIVLARKAAAGEEDTAWFARHGSTPITDIPQHWPEAYRQLVQERLNLIESDPSIRLLEKPEHKRRWASEPWEKQQEAALRSWLLDRLEDRKFWFSQGRPTPRSISQLADQVARDSDLTSVLTLWEGRRDVPIAQSLTRLMTDEAVPYLAAYRLKDSGLRKREAWEETWALQRREDAGEQVGPIPVPPKYTNADFRKAAWWQARGKLDVPKERFILYPDAGRTTDSTMLLGWAGWDHAQQALALAAIIGEREAEGWDDERLIPLVAGLAELQPWVEQWHAEVDPRYGISLAAFCREQLAERSRQVNRSVEELAIWRPEITRGRRVRA
jgi:hypothetical protein